VAIKPEALNFICPSPDGRLATADDRSNLRDAR
jgi:hypothetical protein